MEEDDGVNHGSGEDEVVEEGDSEKQGDWERQRPYGSQGTGKPSDRAWPWPSYKEDFQREWDRKNPDTSSREYRRPHRAEEFFGYFTQQHRSRYTYHSDDQFEQEQQRHRYQHHHHPHWQQQKQHKHTDTGPQTPTEKPEDKADKPKPTDTERRRIVNDKRQALSKCLMELSEASETKAHNMKAQAAGLQKFPKNQSPNEIRIWESHKKLAVRLAESILDLEEKAFNYRVQARRILKKIDETTRDFEEKMKLDKDDREYQESRYGPM